MRLARLILVALLLATSAARAAGNPDAVAVIIGNKSYTAPDVPEVKYADRDAQAMRRYVIDVLGYAEKNVIQVDNAGLTRMLALFGTADAPGMVSRWVRPDGSSDLLVYYSGHGVPGLTNGQSYLLPVDADPAAGEVNGYALKLLYANLEKTAARRIVVLLDACFAGQSGSGAALIHGASVLVRPASPVPSAVVPRLTVLAASGADQLANWDDASGHGLFTEYFLRAVYGNSASGRVTVADVHRTLDREMSYFAGRTLGRDQNASVTGDETGVLAEFPPGHPPQRPTLASIAAPPPPPSPTAPIAAPRNSANTACVMPKSLPGGIAAPVAGWLYLGKVADCGAQAWSGAPHIQATSPVGLAGRRHTVIGDSWLRMDAALPAGRSSRGWRAGQATVALVRNGASVLITRTELYDATDGGYALWALIGR